MEAEVIETEDNVEEDVEGENAVADVTVDEDVVEDVALAADNDSSADVIVDFSNYLTQKIK